MSFPSSNTLGYTGLKETNPPNIRYFRRDPTVNDISGFDIGDFWINTLLLQSWQLMSKAGGVASWQMMGSSSSGIFNLTPDGGGAVAPVAGNVDINGTNGIQTANGGAGVLQITSTFSFSPDVGIAVNFVGANLNVNGAPGIETSNGGADTITISPSDDLAAVEALVTTGVVSRTAADTWATSTITDHACIVGAAGELLTNIGPLADGELLIGSLGADPVAASLTSIGGTIAITPGAGTINLESGGGVASTFTAEDASTCAPVLGNINIVGTATNGISTTAAVDTMTIGMASPYADGDFTFQNTVAATTRVVEILNSDNDPGSYAASYITATAGGGDAFTLWNIAPATRYFAMGIDNSDNDYFKFTHNVDPSSANTIFMVNPAADTFTHYYANILQTQNLVAGGINTIIQNTNNTNIASDAFLRLDVGGAAAGDPFIAYLVTGAGKYAMGIDNTVAGDPFKITDGNSPSDGTDLFTMTSAGVITLANDLDVTEGGTGVSTLTSHGVLMGNGAGDIIATAEPGDGYLLIGKTGDFPQVALLASAAGTVTITPGAGTINLEAGGGVATTYTAEDASTCTPALNNLNIVGTATNGISTTAAGSTMTIAMASPYSVGDFTFTTATAATDRTLTISNTDNTAAASAAHVQVSVGGATSTGDPYTNYLVTGAGTFSVGIDNSDSDKFKITASATPSAGTDLFTMTNAGVITLANDLDVSEGGTGVSTLTQHGILLGNGASDIQALGVGATGTVLIGTTGADPSFSATPTVTSITISNAPSAGTDGTNKTYVDDIAAGFDHKDVCVAASTVDLTVLYDNGVAGVGATLTNNGALAAFSLDGQSPTVGKRVLIKDQATTFQNGIYTVTTVGSGAVAWVLTRATDYDTPLEMQNGSLVPVSAGTLNANTIWMQNVTVVTIGADAVTYQKFQSTPIVTTQYAPLIGAANNAVASVGPLTDGQLLVGSTGVAPVAASLTAGANITITPGAGTITIAATNAPGYLTYAEETGANKTIVINYEYGANRGGGVAFALPAASAVGTRFAITGIAGLWSITQGANQYISLADLTSTVGAVGTLTATNSGDCITCTCIEADRGWRCTCAIGNISVN